MYADASIWLFQFVQAMRDERGELLRNAHVLGFFRRICKCARCLTAAAACCSIACLAPSAALMCATVSVSVGICMWGCVPCLLFSP